MLDPPRRARFPAGWLALLAVAILTGPTAALWAHPFSARFWSHQLLLHASPSQLTVDLEVEVPTPFVMREFFALLGGAEPSRDDDSRFTGARLGDLRQNLRVLVDGIPVPLVDITPTDKPNGVGNSNFFVYHLKMQAPWSPAPGQVYQVEVVDTSDADRELYFRHTARAEEGVEVVDSSTWDPTTQQEKPAAEAWSNNPQQRNLRVALKIPDQGELFVRGVKAFVVTYGRWLGGASFVLGGVVLVRSRRRTSSPGPV